MKFTPMSDADYNQSRSNTFPAGTYPCEIIKCEEKVSKQGNKMFETIVKIYDDSGRTTNVFCYLIAEGKAAWQLRAAAEELGVLDKYNAGELEDVDILGLESYAVVGIQKSEGYADKNIIKSFKANGGEKKASPAVKQKPISQSKGNFDDLDDDINF